ncbi:rND efflux system outer membrane lipoprotein NodT family [Fusobacterium sp. CAG:815]|nr:rND efflux system outer membrane lipoprotein NodT family [Fusobacterium sp. CAG:815]
MKKLKLIILLICLTLMPTQTFAKTKNIQDNNDLQYMNLTWWQKFNDQKLNDYLMTIYKNNPDLKIATIKNKQSQQVMKQAFANQLPQLYFNGTMQREFTGSTQRFGDVVIPDYNQAHYILPLTMSYEVDLWGENYLKTKSLKKQIEMTTQDERASYISISSNFASNYYTLVGIDKLIQNQKDLLEIEQNIVNLEEQKYNSGLCPIAEVLSEKQSLTQMQERLNSLEERQDIVVNQLITQLGDRMLTKIDRSNYDSISTIPTPNEISTEYIGNRPDVQKAELYIQKTGIDIKVARRDFLPKFRVYGQIGFNSYDWCRMFAPHTFLSTAGVAPSLDLFTGGYKKAVLKYNKLEYEKALQIYEKAILTSIQELNDAMMSIKTANSNYEKSKERFNLEKEKLIQISQNTLKSSK